MCKTLLCKTLRVFYNIAMKRKILFILILFLSFSFQAYCAQSFQQWKYEYAARAAKHGIPKNFSLKILKNEIADPEVLSRYKSQVILDDKKVFKDFMLKWLRDGERVKKGKELIQKHYALLDKVEKKFQVDKEVIVALWGTETLYGEIVGNYDLIRSLATLAHEGRRRKFYETQLSAVLRLMKKNLVKREHLKGSWAGATGQCQFMPSNIYAYGQDFDNDGEIDLWNSLPDIFASMAQLLKKAGWKYNKSIGELAKAPISFKGKLDKYRSPQTYNKLGFKTLNNVSFSDKKWKARRAAEIPFINSPVVLRGSNYEPLLRWNRSSLFAAFNIILIEGFEDKVDFTSKLKKW